MPSNLERQYTGSVFRRNMWRAAKANAVECPRCGEIELVTDPTVYVDGLGRKFQESECGSCGHIET